MIIKMRVTYFQITRNFLSWKEGIYTLEIKFRGTKNELLQKLENELEQDLIKIA